MFWCRAQVIFCELGTFSTFYRSNFPNLIFILKTELWTCKTSSRNFGGSKYGFWCNKVVREVRSFKYGVFKVRKIRLVSKREYDFFFQIIHCATTVKTWYSKLLKNKKTHYVSHSCHVPEQNFTKCPKNVLKRSEKIVRFFSIKTLRHYCKEMAF